MSPSPNISKKNSSKKYKPVIYSIGIAIFAYWYAKTLFLAVEGGKVKTLYGLFALPFLLMFPFFLRRFGIFPFFCLAIPLYWIPTGFGAGFFGPLGINLIPTELAGYVFCAVILFSNMFSPGERWSKTWHNFPLKPFSVFFFGAIAAFLYGKSFLGVPGTASIYNIRIFCIYPATICFLCMYLIDSKEKGEKLLWIFLGTTVILGLVILFGKSYSSIISSTDYALHSGRLNMMIRLQLPGFYLELAINPTVVSCIFSVVSSIAIAFWFNLTSKFKKILSLGIVALSVVLMTKSMGRAGIFGCVSSAVIIWYLSEDINVFRRIRNLFKAAVFITTILAVSYFLGAYSEHESYRRKALEMFSNPLHAYSAVSRIEIWKQAIPIIIKHPLGIGGNGLLGISNTYAEMAHPLGNIWAVHNLFLYLLLLSGVLGAAGFSFIFVWFIKKCRAKLKSRNPGTRLFPIVGIGSATALFVNGIASPIIYDPLTATVFWLPIGIIMAVINLPEEKLLVKRNA